MSDPAAERRLKKKKVLLMGKSGSGKSSMRSIIFSNYVAIDTRRLGVTIDVEHSHVKFLGNLNLNLWDCGGQDAFMETYLSVQRDHVFKNAAVLIYVFDAESKEFERDLITYNSCVRALASNSPEAAVFCLVHKIDLVPESYRDTLYAQRVKAIQARSEDFNIITYQTSIWTQSLYRAWSQIVAYLIPNVGEIAQLMEWILAQIHARELILFERTTFLPVCVVSSALARRHGPANRQDRISHIVKNFRQSINKYTNDPSTSAGFATLDIKTPKFSTTCMRVSANMYVFMALDPGEATFNGAVMNLQSCMPEFEKLDVKNTGVQAGWTGKGKGVEVEGERDEDEEVEGEDDGEDPIASRVNKGKGRASAAEEDAMLAGQMGRTSLQE
ncbi:MAG: GTP-binding protein gtr1 [Vezdaea aestivalis]|nr:MAG: GTP-binding protein gtr1 [Vezdaea aestivalis]